MKIFPHNRVVIALLGMTLTLPSLAANQLSDPGFESGTLVPVGNERGWYPIYTAAPSTAFSRSGLWSMSCFASAGVDYSMAVQYLPAAPGAVYTLSGWGYTPSPLNYGLGVLVLSFMDANHQLLGNLIDSPDRITFQSTPGTWIPMSVTATAPSNAAFVYVNTLFWNSSAETPGTAIYFDDVTLAAVPEPSILGLLVLGAIISGWVRYRRQ
jgi:hypothetical protein